MVNDAEDAADSAGPHQLGRLKRVAETGQLNPDEAEFDHRKVVFEALGDASESVG